MTTTIDFDLHGLAGIRLLDASDDDRTAVGRQLGIAPSLLPREPDIVIRFVERLNVASRIRYVGVDEVGFTDDAFLVLRGKQKSRVRVQIPFEHVGQQCEILCERGVLQVPLLIPILNLTILKRGALPLHAAAFVYNDTGFIATGWSKGGKTETLLAFMARGARYIGDEWVYLQADGRRMFGIPEPIRVWNWHLQHLPKYRGLVSRSSRARLRALGLAVAGLERVTAGRSTQTSFSTRQLNRVKSLLTKQLYVDVPPRDLFGPEACQLSGEVDKILFVGNHEATAITVRPIDPEEVAQRMVSSLQFEQMNFMSYYWRFRFAFPDRCNKLLENSRELQQKILKQAVAGKDAYEVSHPYPVAIPSLFEAIHESCMRA